MESVSSLVKLRSDFDKVSEEELQNSFNLLVEFYKAVTEKGIMFLDPNSIAVIKSTIFLSLRLYTEVCQDRFGYDLSEDMESKK